jgi:hypothetical protein
VFYRFATIMAETAYADAVENGVKAARPQTAAEAKAEAHEALVLKVAEMKQNGTDADDIIAMLLNG